MEPSYLELALGELLWRESVFPDVVSSSRLRYFAGIYFHAGRQEPRRSANQRVDLAIHVEFNSDKHALFYYLISLTIILSLLSCNSSNNPN